MGKSLKVARIFGIDIQINWSLVFIFGLLLWQFAWKILPQEVPDQAMSAYLIYGALMALALFFSILFHEMAHSLVMKAFNVPIKKITLFFFGGIAFMEEGPKIAKAEFWIALAGPLSSMILALLLAMLAVTAGSLKLVSASLFWLSYINILLAIFNMIPIFPMDGGRVLRAACWWKTGKIIKATRIALIAAMILGIMLPVAMFFYNGEVFGALWLTFLLWFLIIPFGNAEYESLKEK